MRGESVAEQGNPMTIAYHCPGCQKKLHVAADALGKRVKCPGCGTVFALPAAAPAAPRAPQTEQVRKTSPAVPPQTAAAQTTAALGKLSSSPAANGKSCPSCQAALAADAAICVNCGLDLRSGKKLHSPLPLEPSNPVPVVLIAGIAIGGLAVVMICGLVGGWFLWGSARPMQTAQNVGGKTSTTVPAAGNARSQAGFGNPSPSPPTPSVVGPAKVNPPQAPAPSAAVQSIAATLATSGGKLVTWKGRVGNDGQVLGDSTGSTTYMINLKLKAGSLPAAGTVIVFSGILQPGSATGTDFVYDAAGNQTAVTTVYLDVKDGMVILEGDKAAGTKTAGTVSGVAVPPLSTGGQAAVAATKGGVEVEWNGQWYPAEVLQTKDGKHFIHYTGYGSNWDEWVSPERVRKSDGKALASSPQTLPANSRPAAAPPTPVAEKVAAWQRDWEIFGAELLKAQGDSGFVGKEVEWNGEFQEVSVNKIDGRKTIVVKMPRITLVAVEGEKFSIGIERIFLEPVGNEADAWVSIKPGQKVIFRTRLGKEGKSQVLSVSSATFNGVPEFFAFINNQGARLVSAK